MTTSLYSKTGLSVTGSINKGISDIHIGFTPGEAFKPFNEHKNVDTKHASTLTDTTGSYILDFYNNGSKTNEVGDIGFEQPLHAKTKIVIDLTPSVTHSVAMRNFTSQSRNYPMCYWNKDLKVWEGIGSGKEFSHSDYFYNTYANNDTNKNIITNAYNKLFEEQTIGFTMTSMGGIGSDYFTTILNPTYIRSEIAKNSGAPIGNFMFPVHSKYYGTSSNTINMSDYISKPFLLEKIILEVSLSFHTNRMCGVWLADGFFSQGNPTNIKTTFFVLNQTKGKKEIYESKTDVWTYNPSLVMQNYPIINSNSTIQGNNTTRELVTWGSVSGFTFYGNVGIETNQNIINSVKEVIQSGTLLFGSSSVVSGYDVGEYFNGDLKSLNDFRFNDPSITFPDHLAHLIQLGKDSEYITHMTYVSASTYSSQHPEFNSVVGRNGYIGQSSFDGGYSTWQSNVKLNMKCKVPVKKEDMYFMNIYGINDKSNQNPGETTHAFLTSNVYGSRKMNSSDGKISPRELKNTLRDPGQPQNITSNYTHISIGEFETENKKIYGYRDSWINTPYLLLPSDNLIFGWQLPTMPNLCSVDGNTFSLSPNIESNHTLGPELTFATHPSKITLYGSYISEGQEVHDTINQPLTSNAIHEIIGEE
jgi:hypothetical protein